MAKVFVGSKTRELGQPLSCTKNSKYEDMAERHEKPYCSFVRLEELKNLGARNREK